MIRLKILLQFDRYFYILLLISLLFVFFRIYVIKYHSLINKNEEFSGIITSIVKKEEYYKLTIKNREEIIGYYNNIDMIINLGDRVVVKGNMYEPSNNTIPNVFNYKKYLNNRNIYYLMKIDSLKIVGKSKKISYKIKNYVLDRINKLENKSYMKAFILGDKTDLDEYNVYQENGISHLFALSGMHITLLTGILYFLLKKTKYYDLLIIIILIIYFTVANYSASLLRSIIFFILLKINNKYDLEISVKNILLLTISIILLFNPLIIYDYGFLYSALVTYGLIISKKFYKKNYLYNLLLTSIFAFLWSLPITLSMNYEINVMSIVNNTIIVPLISLIIYPLILITIFFQFLEPILSFFLFVLETINEWLNILKINIVFPKVNIFIFIIYYLLLILFNKSNKSKYLLFSLMFIISLRVKPYLDSSKVYFLDVKQGDSVLMINNHKLLLIDTGGNLNYEISNNIIKLIKSLGYNRLSSLIITHGDYDHMGEAINLVNNFKVEKVIFNCGPYNDLEQELIKVLDKKKIPYYSCIKELNIDDNKLYFLQTKEYDNENDNSNVIYTELNGYKFMFMGDASIITEKEIMNKYNLSDIDVLKVGHHGSKTSSSKEFIDEIEPKYSVISVGKNNRYGHPNKEVLGNLEKSEIYRTDEDGSIMFEIKNNKLKIETCKP